MKNAEYWKKRFEVLEQKQNQIGVQCFSDFEKQFRQAQKQLEGQLSAWYQRFADNNGISIQEARKWLTAAELEEFKWDVNQYIQYGKENAINGQWVKQLENASAKVAISSSPYSFVLMKYASDCSVSSVPSSMVILCFMRRFDTL